MTEEKSKSVMDYIKHIYTSHPDKVLHFAAVYGIVAFGYVIFSFFLDNFFSSALAIVLGLAFSFGKETFDWKWGNTGFSISDLGADFAGLMLAVFMMATMGGF